MPDVDAVGLYRWNGLEGRTPDQTFIRGDAAKFTDWQLGVNFSVPLGLRAIACRIAPVGIGPDA